MPVFKKSTIEIFQSIPPKYFQDPTTSIFLQLREYLFKYCQTLAGFPISFKILGIMPSGEILEDGSVYVNTLVQFCVLKIQINGIIDAIDGLFIDVFPCSVDGSATFTGSFKVTGIEKNKKIIGTSRIEDNF